MKVSLCIIGTGKYLSYLPRTLSSARTFFLTGFEVEFNVFTDAVDEAKKLLAKFKPKVHYVPHLPWPNSTLKRFHFFNQYIQEITGEYVFYVDADVMFVDYINSEVIGDIVAVQHCGYVGERGTYEARPESTAYIAPDEGSIYYGGGFLGGVAREFWRASHEIAHNIDVDESNGIIATYHDESHWNRWLVNNPPTMALSPSYHYPENHAHIYSKWKARGVQYQPKILLLSKNHKKMRE